MPRALFSLLCALIPFTLVACAIGSVELAELDRDCASEIGCQDIDASFSPLPGRGANEAGASSDVDASDSDSSDGIDSSTPPSQVSCTETVAATSIPGCSSAGPTTKTEKNVALWLGRRPHEPGSNPRAALFVGSTALLGFVSLPSDGVYLLAEGNTSFSMYKGLGQASVSAGIATYQVDIERATTCKRIRVVCSGTATVGAP